MLLCPGSYGAYCFWTGKVSDNRYDQIPQFHVANVLIVYFRRQKAPVFRRCRTGSLLIVGGHQVRVGDVGEPASIATRSASTGVVIDVRSIVKEDAVDLFDTCKILGAQLKLVRL